MTPVPANLEYIFIWFACRYIENEKHVRENSVVLEKIRGISGDYHVSIENIPTFFFFSL